ncbi:MAG TPA: nitric-oxide reductase large subunit, partial [Myxococcaceae bacterium]|nr:nitric-oxide reductase large subunit [Myxococcaceae bacterium]
MASIPRRRELLISRAWIQAALLVVLFGFFVLGLLAYRAWAKSAPIPERVVTPDGRLVYTGGDVRAGQVLFLRNGLMQYGSVFGHGAYLGPDYTADYLRRAALSVRERLGGEGDATAAARTVTAFKENRYEPGTGTLVLTAEQAAAFEELVAHYHAFFSAPTGDKGLRPRVIEDPAHTRQLTAFFAWTAWTAATLRPDEDYSYTNNWPPEPLVDNRPTGAMVVWSVLSLIALLGGIGLLLAAFGRWNFLGWHGREHRRLSFIPPSEVALTPSQRACAWFFLVMVVLFLAQALLGGATQHYRAELAGFFGWELSRLLPFNLARTWHLQLALLWVATSFLAAGIFLAPYISGREPKKQSWLAYALLG